MNTKTNDNRVRTLHWMRVREGYEAQFEDAWRTAAEEISRMPGNLRQELTRDAEDPRTFLIAADWSDRASLDEFARSAARERLTAALCDLRESADKSTYHLVHAVAGQGPRIRVAVKITVAEGEEEAFELAYREVAKLMRGTPGHVREELLREPGTSTFHLFAEWENAESFNAWADNPAHLDQTKPILPYLMASFERAIYHIVARPDEAFLPELAPSTLHISVNGVQPGTEASEQNGMPAMQSSTDVLIVGAGPAGLTAAIELARRGVACRIIDKRVDASGSADKAIGVQCRTMEIWEDIGVAREAMDAGIWLHGQTVFVNGRQTRQVDWDLPDLPFAHLGLPQYETERILTKRLADHGVVVERGRELRSLTQDDAGVTAQLVHASGASEAVRARYLVGSDGAHSTVRKILGLNFEGGLAMFPQLFMLGDVDLDWSMPEGHLLRFIQLEDGQMTGMLVSVPLRGPGRYRVATLAPAHLAAAVGSGEIPPGFSQEYAPPTLADIQAVVDQLAPAGTTASNLRWSSIFRIKHGIVDRYRDGRVFVAGDAAHLHPPSGGQGMNTGIQDAWNLGWKLALAVRGLAAPGLLDSYEAERWPAGKAIVDRSVRFSFTDEIDMDEERAQFLTEMQMDLTYAGSPLVGEALENAAALGAGPKPGDRAPDVEQLRRFGVGHPVRLFELTRGTAHTLFVYADAMTSSDEMFEFEKLAAKVREEDPDLLNIYVLASPDAAVPSGLDFPVLQDSANAFRAAYGVSGTSAYLIRPDGHVGFRCAPIDTDALDEHLAKTFTA